MKQRTAEKQQYKLGLLAICLSGCFGGSSQVSEDPASARYTGTTLADLEGTSIAIEEQALADASPEMALESYRRAVDLFEDPERRAQSLRRMADLALSTAEDREGQADEQRMQQATPGVSREELDRDIDAMLYENFMREAHETEDREERLALLDMAGSMVTSLEGSELETDYRSAITLYRALLDSTDNPQQRAEAWYLLAKAYDLAGELDESLNALTTLVTEHPDSEYYVESQFRRAELLFSFNEFDTAERAYAEVLRQGGTDSDFYEQAIYKQGWSHYKLADYDGALLSFMTLMDHLHGSPRLEDPATMEAKLAQDTQRVISLTFTQLEGPASLRDWFARRGQRPYEADLYRALGDVYLRTQRFRDAADTYEMFVSVYPQNWQAPEFSTLEIEAYQKGGFPSLVLPAKENFVERYGINSQFWEQHPDIRETYVSQLRGHILDLARHHHSLAQESGAPDDYQVPARWYREYLDTPPADERQAEINHRYAEVLFAGQRFVDAVAEFERTAYQYPDYEDADEAGYFALVAYQSHYTQMPEETEEQQQARSAWLDRKIDGSLQFVRTYPAHERAPRVLYNVSEDQLALGRIDDAVSTAGMLVSREPPPSEDLMRYGWQTIANGEFDMARYDVAEFAYNTLLELPGHEDEERQTYRERLAASIYRQAEQQQEQGLMSEAASTFMRAAATVPEAEVRKNAEFDAAGIYLELGEYQQAIPILEAFRERFADDPLAETIPDRLAMAYEETGNYTAAARELETIADNYGEEQPELAREALWAAAEMQDRAGDPEASIRLWRKYVWDYPEPLELRAEVQHKLTGLYEQIGDDDRRAFWLNKLVETMNEAGDAASTRVAWLGAWAAFTLAEPEFEAFAEIQLTQPLRRSLEQKTTAMRRALQSYELVADVGVAEFATAANYKIGEMYRVLALDIMDSERPRGLNSLELDQYEILLEEQALPYEDQAIDILIANTDMVAEDIYDQWVKRSFDALGELLPGRYAKYEQVESYVDIIY